MSVAISLNPMQVAPSAPLEPVPSGIYPVCMINSKEDPINGKPGQFLLNCELQVQDGEFKGRKLFYRINHKHEDSAVRERAYADLSAIAHVIGKGSEIINATGQLHGQPFKVNVLKLERKDQPGTFSNEIRGILDMAGNPPGKTGASASDAAAASNAGAFGNDTPAAATTTAPVVPAAPTAPVVPSAPVAPTFPPEGWTAHPQSAGWYYKGNEVLSEQQLRDKMAAAAPAVPEAPAVPAAPTGGADAGKPDWAQ